MGNYDGYVTIGTKLDTSGLSSSLAQMQNQIDKSTTKMTNTIKKSFSSLKRFILGLGIFSLVRSLFDMGDAVSRVDTLNNYVKVMSNLGISAEEADKSVNLLSDKLQGLPTTLDDAALSVQRLTAANGNIEASTEMFLALNNAILAGGASTEIQKSALEQLSQAYSKGKPDMMEWRTALMAMPAQLKQVAMAMGYVNADQLGEALRSGKISMDDFMTTITKLNRQGINGFQSFEEQAFNSTGGIKTSIINLKTAITRGLADIMNSVGQSNIAAFFNRITDAIKKCIPYVSAFVKAILMLFGIKSKDTNKGATGTVASIGSAGTTASKGLDKATGSAKKLNKELKGLAGFDEANVLPSKTDTSGGADTGIGSAVGGSLGEIDTSLFDKGMGTVSKKVEELAKKIYNVIKPIFEFIKDNWLEILGFFAGVKLAPILGDLLTMKGLFEGIKAVGLGLAIAGIIHTFREIKKFIKDPSFKNFMGILEGIAMTVLGISAYFGAWPVAIAAALALVVIEVIKHWDKVKELFLKFIDWLDEKFGGSLKAFFKVLGDIIVLPFQVAIEFIKSLFTGLYNGVKKIIDGICDIFKGNFKEGIKKILSGFGDILKAPFKALYDAAKVIIDKIINLIKDMIDWCKKAINWLKDIMGFNDDIREKEKKVITDVMEKAGYKVTVKNGKYQITKMAAGGIINQPGRGVPLASAIGATTIGGEAGREGVVPLDNASQMALIGREIAKYVNINNYVTNNVDGRRLNTILRQSENRERLATNG